MGKIWYDAIGTYCFLFPYCDVNSSSTVGYQMHDEKGFKAFTNCVKSARHHLNGFPIQHCDTDDDENM